MHLPMVPYVYSTLLYSLISYTLPIQSVHSRSGLFLVQVRLRTDDVLCVLCLYDPHNKFLQRPINLSHLNYNAPQVRSDWGSNSSPLDHDSTFHVTEPPALTTWPSVIAYIFTDTFTFLACKPINSCML